MTELQLSPEEQAYLEAETGQKAEPAPVQEVEKEEAPAKADEQAKGGTQEGAEGEKTEGAEEEAGGEKEAAVEPFKRRTPIDTIRELRAERRELRNKVKEFDEFRKKAQQRLETLTQFQVQAQAPDKEMEPEAHARYMEKVEAEKAQEHEQERAKTSRNEEIRGIIDYAYPQEVEFAKQHADYDSTIKAAREIAIENRTRELMELDASEDQATELAEREINEYILQRATFAKSKGVNFAKIAYKEAQAVISRAKAGKQPVDAGEKPTETTKIDASQLKPLADGKSAARNPKNSDTSKELTLEAVVGMSEEEFAKIASDPKKVKKLFGA